MDNFELQIRQYARNHKQDTLWDEYDLTNEVKFSKTLATILKSRHSTAALIGYLGGDIDFARHEVDTEVVNVDVLVRTYDPDQEVIIENKIFSTESDNQIQKYVNRLGLFKQHVLFVTPEGRNSDTYPLATPIRICDLLELINSTSDPIVDRYRYAMAKIVNSTESDAKLLSIYDEHPDIVNRMVELVNNRKLGYMESIKDLLIQHGFHVIVAQASRIQFRLDTDSPVNKLGSGTFVNDRSLGRMEMFTKNDRDLYIKYVIGPGDARNDLINHLRDDESGLFSFRDKNGSVYTQAFTQFLGNIQKYEESITKRQGMWMNILRTVDKWNP